MAHCQWAKTLGLSLNSNLIYLFSAIQQWGIKYAPFRCERPDTFFQRIWKKNKSDISTGDYQNYWVVSFEILAAVISKVDLNEASEFFTNQYNNYI